MRRSEFDLVITEIYMDAMDGFSFLQHIVGQINIPVITMCPDDDPKLHSQALIGGACFHLVKPLNMNNMEVVWHKAWRNKGKAPLIEMPNIMNPFGLFPKVGSTSSQAKAESSKRKKRRKEYYHNADDDDDEEKKSRLQWDPELHRRFLVAVRLLGKQAVPAKIVDLMNVEGLTNKQISSHLQKYRNRVDKVKEEKTTTYLSKTSHVNSKSRVTVPNTIGMKKPMSSTNNNKAFYNLAMPSTTTIFQKNAFGGNYVGNPFSNQNMISWAQTSPQVKDPIETSVTYGDVDATTNFVEEWPGLDDFLGIEERSSTAKNENTNVNGGALDINVEDFNFDDDAFLAEILNDIE